MFVAKGQGLIEVRIPNQNAEIKTTKTELIIALSNIGLFHP